MKLEKYAKSHESEYQCYHQVIYINVKDAMLIPDNTFCYVNTIKKNSKNGT